MHPATSVPVVAAIVVPLAGAVAGAEPDLSPAISVIETVPIDVPGGPLSLPPSQPFVGAFGGQPRIDNDGNWYGLFRFPVSNPSDPFEYTRDNAYFRNGEPWSREGYQLPNSQSFVPVADFPVSQQAYSDVSIGSGGAVAQVIRGVFDVPTVADGTPNAALYDFETTDFPRFDAAVVDNEVLLVEGDLVPPMSELFDFGDGPVPLFRISSVYPASYQGGPTELVALASFSFDDNTFAPEFDAAFRVTDPGTPQQAATLLFTSEPGNPLPGLHGIELSTYSRGEEGLAYRGDGSFVFTGDIRGEPFDTDDALFVYNRGTDSVQLLIQAGDPSPIPGADYFGLLNNPVAFNDQGDWAIRADTTADFATDQIIVVNGQQVIREDDIVGTAAPGPLQLDAAIANIELDREGNVIWYGPWSVDGLCDDISDSGFGIFEGIFFNDRLLIEAGVTSFTDVQIGDTLFPELVVKDLPNTEFGGFTVSPEGDRLITFALLAEPSDEICDFSINVDRPVAQVLLEIDLAQVRAILDADVPCPGDTDGDLTVGLDDLLTVLANFGDAVGGGPSDGDLDGSGTVGLEDLLVVLSNFGSVCG